MEDERMHKNFFKNFKLHEVCADDSTRPQFRYVHFANGYAYATNSRIAVRARIGFISSFTPEEIKLLDGKDLDYRLFKKLLAYDVVNVTDDGIMVDSDEAPVFFGFSKQSEIKFPNVQTVFDGISSQEDHSAICFSASYLKKLCSAMDLSAPVLTFCKGSIVKVTYTESKDPKIATITQNDIAGILMSILID